jgi:hypothetical protein
MSREMQGHAEIRIGRDLRGREQVKPRHADIDQLRFRTVTEWEDGPEQAFSSWLT